MSGLLGQRRAGGGGCWGQGACLERPPPRHPEPWAGGFTGPRRPRFPSLSPPRALWTPGDQDLGCRGACSPRWTWPPSRECRDAAGIIDSALTPGGPGQPCPAFRVLPAMRFVKLELSPRASPSTRARGLAVLSALLARSLCARSALSFLSPPSRHNVSPILFSQRLHAQGLPPQASCRQPWRGAQTIRTFRKRGPPTQNSEISFPGVDTSPLTTKDLWTGLLSVLVSFFHGREYSLRPPVSLTA